MNKVLLPVFYLPPIAWFSKFLEENTEIVFEQYENFPKQTYRNRCHIYGANGKLPLIIPIKHNGKRVIHEIEISNDENWRNLHWKSIKNAYQSSPYFEYYEDKLQQIFDNPENKLLQFNIDTISIIQKIIKTNQSYHLTTEYDKNPELEDFRAILSPKKELGMGFDTYYQVFSDKLGFIDNLSILDLICNLGPESLSYLKKTEVKFNE